MTSTTDTSKLVLADPREDTWPRWRFAASIGLYGAALGASVVVTNIVGLTSKFAVDADALPPSDILYFMIVGGLSGLVVAGIAGYLMNRSSRAFASSTPRHPLGILPWAAIGAAWWVAFSLLLGGVMLPQANVVLAYVDGAIPFLDFVGFTLDTIFGVPFRMVSEGGRFMYTAIPAASGVRAWRMAHRPSCSLRPRADGPVRPTSPRGAAFGHRDRRCPHPAAIGPLAHRKRHDGDAVVQVGRPSGRIVAVRSSRPFTPPSRFADAPTRPR